MFNSRGPRSRKEVQDCIALLKASPFWPDSGPDLMEQDVVDCWVKLLKSGTGIIDIIDNDDEFYQTQLKNEEKAKTNPHYKHGFFCVWFVCYISEEFAREILTQTNDEVDPILLFMLRCIQHEQKASNKSPVVSLGKDGEVPEGGLYGFSLAVYHSNAIFDPSKQVNHVYNFTKRVEKSTCLACSGFMHNAWINLHAGVLWLDEYIEYGYGFVRRYSTNKAQKDQKLHKFVLCVTKSDREAENLHTSKDTSINSILRSRRERQASAGLPPIK